MGETTSDTIWWRRGAAWVARTELVWLALAAPLLLFPSHWTPLAALLIGLCWLARWLSCGRLTVPTPLNTPLFLLVCLALVAFVISPAPNLSADKLWGIILQAAIYFGVANSVTTERGLRYFTLLFLLGICVLALISLLGTDWSSVRLWEQPQVYKQLPQLDLASLGIRGSILNPERSLFNPRQVGGVLATLLPLALILVLNGQVWWLRLAAGLALFSGVTVLLLSQALMGWFGFLVALLAILVWRWRWLFWTLLLGGVGLTVAVWRFTANSNPVELRRMAAQLLDINNVVGIGIVLRLDIWSRAVAMIREMPFTGVGLNTFPLVQSHFYTGFLIGPEPHAHNLWLQLAIDLGLPGILLFVWFLVAFFYMSYVVYQRKPGQLAQWIIVGSAAGVLAYVASGTLDVVTLGAKPLAAWWGLVGLTGAIWRQTHPVPTGHPAWRNLTLASGATLLLLISLYFLPAVRWRNHALLLAQPALITARQTGTLPQEAATSALAALDEAIRLNPERAQLWGTRGSLSAWSGQFDAAYADLAQRVQLDSQHPWPAYAPFLAWYTALNGETLPAETDALLQIYNQWLSRFPERAENYALVAILYLTLKDNPATAQIVVQQGHDAGAQPEGLLDTVAKNIPSNE